MSPPEEKIVREFRHMLVWPLQLRRLGPACRQKTHWDALAHVSYGGVIYNGYPASAVSEGGIWKTPKPSCGITLPSLSVRVGTVETVLTVSLLLVGVVVGNPSVTGARHNVK